MDNFSLSQRFLHGVIKFFDSRTEFGHAFGHGQLEGFKVFIKVSGLCFSWWKGIRRLFFGLIGCRIIGGFVN